MAVSPSNTMNKLIYIFNTFKFPDNMSKFNYILETLNWPEFKYKALDAINDKLLGLIKVLNTTKNEGLAVNLVDLAKHYARRPDEIIGP